MAKPITRNLEWHKETNSSLDVWKGQCLRIGRGLVQWGRYSSFRGPAASAARAGRAMGVKQYSSGRREPDTFPGISSQPKLRFLDTGELYHDREDAEDTGRGAGTG